MGLAFAEPATDLACNVNKRLSTGPRRQSPRLSQVQVLFPSVALATFECVRFAIVASGSFVTLLARFTSRFVSSRESVQSCSELDHTADA